MQELEIFISILFKIFFYVAILWSAYIIGEINGIEEAKRIWMRYSEDCFDEEEQVNRMSDKTCKTCVDNDEGLCDRKGIIVEEDDTCEKYRDCIGCFGAAGDDCQKCQEERT